jgi:hypothetical protein
VTDAWNGIVVGTKWWAYLPKDFYEADDEWTCDPECSPVEENDLHNAALWIYNMLPQLRFAHINAQSFSNSFEGVHGVFYCIFMLHLKTSILSLFHT